MSISVDNDDIKAKLSNGDVKFKLLDEDEKEIKCLEKLCILKFLNYQRKQLKKFPNLSKISWKVLKNHYKYCAYNTNLDNMYDLWMYFPHYLKDFKKYHSLLMKKMNFLNF